MGHRGQKQEAWSHKDLLALHYLIIITENLTTLETTDKISFLLSEHTTKSILEHVRKISRYGFEATIPMRACKKFISRFHENDASRIAELEAKYQLLEAENARLRNNEIVKTESVQSNGSKNLMSFTGF